MKLYHDGTHDIGVAGALLIAFRDGRSDPEAMAGAMLIAKMIAHIEVIARGLGVLKGG